MTDVGEVASAFSYGDDSIRALRAHKPTSYSRQAPFEEHRVSEDLWPKDDSDDHGENASDIRPLRRRSTLSKSYTSKEEAAVVRKLDHGLVLFLAFLYLLGFLDRSNIGNARIAGLERSLSMTSQQYNLCLLAFYLTYITFEWMILLYRLLPAHVYISICVLAWGLVASLQSLVTSFRQLLVLRALLGLTEAAFGPGVPFYMTFFYRREELAYRVGMQISAAPLATSFASALAWIIMQLARKVGLEQWRALFLIEGFPSILTAVWAWYWIPDGPGTVRWLTPRERKVASLRVQGEMGDGTTYHGDPIGSSEQRHRQRPVLSEGHADVLQEHRYYHKVEDQSQLEHRTKSKPRSWLSSRINIHEIKATLLDPKAYLTSLMFLSVNVSFASLPVFLPTIINSMSFSPLTSQILSAPPYFVSFLFVLLISHLSDTHSNSRSTYLCLTSLLSATSYIAIACASFLEIHAVIPASLSITIRYLSIYPASMGLFSSVVLIITWTLNNQRTSTGKGTGMILLNIVGQCGPLIGVGLFPLADGPHYTQGMIVCAVFMFCVTALSLTLRFWLQKENKHMLQSEQQTGQELESLEREVSQMEHSKKHDDSSDDSNSDSELVPKNNSSDHRQEEEARGLINDRLSLKSKKTKEASTKQPLFLYML